MEKKNFSIPNPAKLMIIEDELLRKGYTLAQISKAYSFVRQSPYFSSMELEDAIEEVLYRGVVE